MTTTSTTTTTRRVLYHHNRKAKLSLTVGFTTTTNLAATILCATAIIVMSSWIVPQPGEPQSTHRFGFVVHAQPPPPLLLTKHNHHRRASSLAASSHDDGLLDQANAVARVVVVVGKEEDSVMVGDYRLLRRMKRGSSISGGGSTSSSSNNSSGGKKESNSSPSGIRHKGYPFSYQNAPTYDDDSYYYYNHRQYAPPSSSSKGLPKGKRTKESGGGSSGKGFMFYEKFYSIPTYSKGQPQQQPTPKPTEDSDRDEDDDSYYYYYNSHPPTPISPPHCPPTPRPVPATMTPRPVRPPRTPTLHPTTTMTTVPTVATTPTPAPQMPSPRPTTAADPTRVPATPPPTPPPTTTRTDPPTAPPVRVTSPPTATSPTVSPTPDPTGMPTKLPPTTTPTSAPTDATPEPTSMPSTLPPTTTPTSAPTDATPEPTSMPSTLPPTTTPTSAPTDATPEPTSMPSTLPPTTTPTSAPTMPTTLSPTTTPTSVPTAATQEPTGMPATVPTTTTPTTSPIGATLEPTNSPTTLVPTMITTDSPTTALPVSDIPTVVVPISILPSATPTIAESIMPPEPTGNSSIVPANDRCEDATVISTSSYPFETQGTTVGATPDLAEITCSLSPLARGVWYTILGTGKLTRITYEADSYNEELSVFSSNSSCSDLVCEEYADSILDWVTQNNVSYYILLTGNNEQSVGPYTFTVTDYETPANNNCVNAELISMDNLPFTTQGTTLGAVDDFTNGGCGVPTTSRGVWYTLTGTGRVTRVVLDSDVTDSFAIFTGSSCDALECFRFVSMEDEFVAEANVTYYIYLYGFSPDTAGPYELTVSDAAVPENDNCGTAVTIAGNSLPFTTEGTTAGASIDFSEPTCGLSSTSRGVWYTLVGTGRYIRVTYEADYSDDIAVLSGSCVELQCIVISPFLTEFVAQAGVRYYIVLSGTNFNATGPYSLTVSEFEIPPNDGCSNAIAIPSLPFETEGTTLGSFADFSSFNCGISLTSRGVWYSLVGAGRVTRTVYQGEHNVETSIFTGSCVGGLSCLEHGDEIVDWIAETGVTYLILLSGLNFQSVGDYTLQVSDFEIPVNDECSGAIAIPSSGNGGLLSYETEGTTAGALSDFESTTCSLLSSSRGVWYSFVGSGRTVRLVYETEFSQELSVFSGTCSELECQENGGDSVEFVAEDGVTYYVLLSGSDFDNAGSFAFTLSELLASNT
ncbi:hypothetical protein ACA910_004524 [Epithemia clementina (nom. ined.)]